MISPQLLITLMLIKAINLIWQVRFAIAQIVPYLSSFITNEIYSHYVFSGFKHNRHFLYCVQAMVLLPHFNGHLRIIKLSNNCSLGKQVLCKNQVKQANIELFCNRDRNLTFILNCHIRLSSSFNIPRQIAILCNCQGSNICYVN